MPGSTTEADLISLRATLFDNTRSILEAILSPVECELRYVMGRGGGSKDWCTSTQGEQGPSSCAKREHTGRLAPDRDW